MHDREDEVTEAHTNTFEWIFQPAETGSSFGDHFTNWLTAEQEPIYWVTGKPGSGKSTLFRFLFNHEATAEHLQQWAAASQGEVAKAGFFFWTSGSEEQRSQRGLLRSILHQLLSLNRDLIPVAMPELWDQIRGLTTKERVKLVITWRIPTLTQAFNALIQELTSRSHVCLFIDGLDEFDGDHGSIIRFFKDLGEGAHGQRIKMCLSSRPWSVFEKAFDRSVPNLKLQELSQDDMNAYARDRLHRHPLANRWAKEYPERAERLILDVAKKADGVFLWVRLAMDQILASFRHEGFNKVHSMLESLPSDLDMLFEKLLFENQNATQVAKTAALFQLMHGREIVADFLKDDSANSLRVWELTFALADEDDKQVFELPIDDIDEIDERLFQQCCQTTRSEVHARFAGLLDIFTKPLRRGRRVRAAQFSGGDDGDEVLIQPNREELAASKVTYIHRTVRDWLLGEAGAAERLFRNTPIHFDPHLRMLRSFVMRLKLPLEEVEHHRRLDEWYPDIALALTHARHVSNDPSSLQRRLLDELNKTMNWWWLSKESDLPDQWARSAFGSYEARMKAPPIIEPFLCMATKFGLTTYIQEVLDSWSGLRPEYDGLDGASDATPLLTYATEFTCSRKTTVFPLSDPRMVEYLLTHTCEVNSGANVEYAGTTPWLLLLRHLRDARRRRWIAYYDTDPEGTARWTEIVRLFIEAGGADVRAVVLKDNWDPEITALGVMELLLETYGAVEVRDLRDEMKMRGAKA